jgi:hypothetical protein
MIVIGTLIRCSVASAHSAASIKRVISAAMYLFVTVLGLWPRIVAVFNAGVGSPSAKIPWDQEDRGAQFRYLDFVVPAQQANLLFAATRVDLVQSHFVQVLRQFCQQQPLLLPRQGYGTRCVSRSFSVVNSGGASSQVRLFSSRHFSAAKRNTMEQGKGAKE